MYVPHRVDLNWVTMRKGYGEKLHTKEGVALQDAVATKRDKKKNNSMHQSTDQKAERRVVATATKVN